MTRDMRGGWSRDWRGAERILAIRLDSLGDVLMTSPAFRAIKQLGLRHITLLTSPSGAEVARLIPEVDEVVEYAAPWVKGTEPRTSSSADIELINRLGRLRFDAAIIFTVYSQNPLPAALMSFLAGIPMRLAHCRENPYDLLTHWLPEIEPEHGVRHEVRRQLDLVESVGYRTDDRRLSLKIPGSAAEAAKRILTQRGLDLDRAWIVVHPGATAASRRYPPELFAKALRALSEVDGLQIVFTGGTAEAGLVQTVREMAGCGFSLAGELRLEELAAVLSMAPLLLSNNTGPVHIAAATGTPVVDLYALTNPQHTPWKVPARVLSHDVPCRFCYKSVCPEGHQNCLRLVSPEAVVDAVRSLLLETIGLNRAGGAWLDRPKAAAR
jgi:lipopolysaccharide heptosyltransferase II